MSRVVFPFVSRSASRLLVFGPAVFRLAVLGIAGLALPAGLPAQTLPVPASPVPASEWAPAALDLDAASEGHQKISGRGQPSANGRLVWVRFAIDGQPASVRAADSQPWRNYVLTDAEGYFRAELAGPLEAGQQIRAVQSSGDGSTSSAVAIVGGRLDWGRTRANLTLGTVASRNADGGSRLDPFLGLALETVWRFRAPLYYFRVNDALCPCGARATTTGPVPASTSASFTALPGSKDAGVPPSAGAGRAISTDAELPRGSGASSCAAPPEPGACFPGWYSPARRWLLHTFLAGRLTSIPLSSPSEAAASARSASANATATRATQNPVAPLEGLLGSRKAVDLSLGAVVPVLLTQWRFGRADHALYIGPVGRLGIYSPAGAPSPPRVISTAGLVDANTAPASTLTYGGGQAIYSYFSAGVRLGQFRMPSSRNVAPREAWRIDLAWGRYSNLKTIYGYASEYWPASGQTVTAYFTATQPRLIMEGFLTIPSTPFLLGFEANVKTKPNPANLFGRNGLLPPHPSVERLAAGPYLLPAHDDLRFILGARFDAAALAGKFVGTR